MTDPNQTEERRSVTGVVRRSLSGTRHDSGRVHQGAKGPLGNQRPICHRGTRLFRDPDNPRQVLFGERRTQRSPRRLGVLGGHRRHHLRHALPRRGMRQDWSSEDAHHRVCHVCHRTRTRGSVWHDTPRPRAELTDVPCPGSGPVDLRGCLRSVPTSRICRGQAVHQPQNGGNGVRSGLRPDEPRSVLLRIRFADHPASIRRCISAERSHGGVLGLHRSVRPGAGDHPDCLDTQNGCGGGRAGRTRNCRARRPRQ